MGRGPAAAFEADAATEGNELSVHGEYARALEGMIASVGALDRPDRAEWLSRLAAARVQEGTDLSAAARSAREAIAAFEAALGSSAEWGPRVEEARAHLLAHVRIILGETA